VANTPQRTVNQQRHPGPWSSEQSVPAVARSLMPAVREHAAEVTDTSSHAALRAATLARICRASSARKQPEPVRARARQDVDTGRIPSRHPFGRHRGAHQVCRWQAYRVGVSYCRCCRVDNAIFSPPKQVNGLPMATIVCDLCIRHQGSDAHDLKKAADMHHKIWQEHERERVESLIDAWEAKLRERDAEVEKLRHDLDERPVQVIEKWVDADEVEEAKEFARRAYATREHAFRQLCLVHMNHHELRGERCSCGRSIAECDVVGILEGYRALLRWERTQEERQQRGLPHGLPYDYVRKLGRRTDGDEPHEFDAYPYGSTGS